METESLFKILPIVSIIILFIGFLLLKSEDGNGTKTKMARNLIYGPLSKPFHESFAKIFERPLSKREKIGWYIVISLMVLAFLADYLKK